MDLESIRVNVVLPEAVATPPWQSFRDAAATVEKSLDQRV
jgi:hypothetical protein